MIDLPGLFMAVFAAVAALVATVTGLRVLFRVAGPWLGRLFRLSNELGKTQDRLVASLQAEVDTMTRQFRGCKDRLESVEQENADIKRILNVLLGQQGVTLNDVLEDESVLSHRRRRRTVASG